MSSRISGKNELRRLQISYAYYPSYLSLEGENDEKKIISNKQKLIHRNEERMERSKMNHCATLHASWRWNYGGLKVNVEEAFCVLQMRNELFFIFDWLHLVTDVSYMNDKGVIFIRFASSFMWCEHFVQEEHFILTIFLL